MQSSGAPEITKESSRCSSITVLGSGTSVGVPTIGCSCAVCRSEDPRDKRLRPSILISLKEGERERNVLVDTTPDFRQQALRAGFKTLDAILYTHSHADHIMGLDDVRPFNYGRKERIPIYATADTQRSLQRVFPYAFEGEMLHPGGKPRVVAQVIDDEPIDLFGVSFHPIPLIHGPKRSTGFRFGRAAYLTDHSDIPEKSVELLYGLDVLFLDALRREPHPMHTTLKKALSWVVKLKPKYAYFTHICHDLQHASASADLPPNVKLSYDGLHIELQRLNS